MFVGVFGTFLLLWTVPARPTSAIRHAQSFVDCLGSHELERAYRLTTQRGEVGRSFGDFQGIVRQQWPGVTASPVRFLSARPAQSYGNRLRRWFQGREIEPPERWLEFSADGVPFQVRETRAGGREWRVSSFQSHAG